MLSSDMCSLFPSVPVNKLFNLLKSRINSEIVDEIISSELVDLTKLCIYQNYFKFDDKIFIQTDGLAMGSAFSPFGAEFFMDDFESRLFDSVSNFSKHVFKWYRYVDDVFCIWTGTERQLYYFLHKVLNKIDENIKFTIEIGNKSLNFLDLTIEIVDNDLKFDIYRKNTYSDAIIPRNSTHPWSTKMAAFHSMLDRLLSVPLAPDAFKKEIGTIKQIAVNNGYERSTIHELLRKKVRKKNRRSIFPMQNTSQKEKEKVWRRIPYIGEVSDRLIHPLRANNIEPAFFNNNTLKNLLVNNKIKAKENKFSKSGIYKIECDDCHGIYVGKTKRTLKTRIKEHIQTAKYANPTSGLAKHLKITGHKIKEENVELLKSMKGGKVLDAYEIYEIRKAKQDGCLMLNDQIDFKNKSPLLCPLLFRM